MNVGKFYLAFYAVHSIIFLLILYYCVLSNPSHRLSSSIICNLGKYKSKRNSLFNINFIVFGLLSITFTYLLSSALRIPNYSHPGIVGLYIVSITTFLNGIFTYDRNKNIHSISAGGTLLGAILSSSFLIKPILISDTIPDIIIVINVAILVLSFLTVLSGYAMTLASNFDSKFYVIFKNIGFFQWPLISLCAIWDSLLSLFASKNI